MPDNCDMQRDHTILHIYCATEASKNFAAKVFKNFAVEAVTLPKQTNVMLQKRPTISL